MSDSAAAPESVPPISPSPESTPEPEQQAAPVAVPAEPPPASGDQAGADAPPADAPPGDVPAAAAPEAPVIESVPVPEGAKTSEPITTPVEARAALGDESGVPANVTDEIRVIVNEPIPEDPYVTLQRLRTKLSAYGEECLKTVQPEVEYLISLCSPEQSDPAEG